MAQPSRPALTHLSLFAHEIHTGRPLARTPVYAEVAVTAPEESPAVVDNRFGDAIGAAMRDAEPDCFANPQCRERLLAAVRAAIARVLAPAARDALAQDADRANNFARRVLRRAREANGNAPLGALDDEALKQRLEAAVRDEAERQHLALNPPPKLIKWAHPLGILGADHAGYLSFDLTRLPATVHAAVVKAIEARKKDPQAVLETAVLVYPTAQEAIRFDALTQGRFAHDAIVLKIEMLPPNLPAVVRNLGLLAMQSPGLTDWRLSPASFAGNPGALVGQDGCETMLPANVATQEFEFFQVIRLTNVAPEPDDERRRVQLGVVHEYRHTWYPLGHSLGQILYSLPLAPGESVNLAVIDWSRHDAAQRDEKTKLNEQLVHNQRRDRTISETVNAAIKEHQSGSSFMAGLAASGGIAGEIGKFGIASGLAGALGGSSSDSAGSRDLAASTVQQLGESIMQASTAMRELHSTVVVRSTQAEREAIETRTVANYNHSHTLTILYYEVLRHFRTVTRLAHRRPAVLVKGEPFTFGNDDTIIEHRFALERALLDERLRPCFEAVDKLICLRAERDAAKKSDVRNFRFYQFHLEWLTGQNWEEKSQLRFALVLKNDNVVRLLRVPGAGAEPDEHRGAPFTMASGGPGPGGGFADSFLRPEGGPVSYSAIKAIRVKFAGTDHVRPERTPFVLGDWILGALRMHGTHAAGERMIFDGLLNKYLEVVPGGPQWAEFDIPVWSPPDQLLWDEAPPTYLDLPEPSRCCFARLRSHIGAYAAYYTRFLWMNEDREARAQRFEKILIPGIGTLLDAIENRPLDVVGEYVAFACTHVRWKQLVLEALWRLPSDFDDDERLVTLPTRGIFAEAKLGHCNASEEIDNTRFWDWQTSPIPHFAAQIMPVQAVTPTPQQANVTPTPFPSSLVNIVNPPSAPDPHGLAAALTAITTPNIFRDMSGQKEVAQLLQQLSDNTIDIAKAADAAREITKKQKSAEGGGKTGAGGARANPAQPSAVNRDLQDFGKVLKRAVGDNLTTPETAKELWNDAARGAYPKLELDFAIDEADAAAGASALPPKYTEPLKPARETKLQQALDNARNALAQPLRDRIDRIAITLVDLSAAPSAWAGHRDDEFDFSGSLLKVAAVYAAFELRAAARRLARVATLTTKSALVSRLKTEFDPQIKAALPGALRGNPKLVARNPAAGQAALLPDYEKALTVTAAGKVDLEPAFKARLEHLFADQNQNDDAQHAVHLLGYGYIGAALMAAGFYDDTTGRGIWLAGDYGGGFAPVKIPCDNDGTTAQGTTTRQFARLLALLFRKELFDDPADAQEKVASSTELLGFMAKAGSWFDQTWTQNATAPFRMTQAKVGEGAGGGGVLFSEGGIFRVLTPAKDFAIVWQNMKGSQDIPALAELVKKTVETYLTP